MTNLVVCRVCLSSDIKMRYIANTRYQEIFEKLSTKLKTEDGRPDTICYICYSQLQRCCQFVDMSRKAEEVLTKLSHSHIKLNENTINIIDRKFGYKLTRTPLQHISVNIFENTSIVKKEYDLSNVKVESVNIFDEENEPINEVNVSNISESMIEACVVKQEVHSESEDICEDSEEQRVMKQEVEYESCLDPEVDKDAEGYYEEISITKPAPSERHACPLCEKSYTHKFHLNRHIKTHAPSEEKKEYTCEYCGMRFSQKSTLKKHYFTHTKEKPFACNLCPARCTQKIDLERHKLTHTGQKSFTCDICKQSFGRKCNMKLHILTHFNTKPFECQICNITFSRTYDLKRHNRRKHTPEKPFACDKCDFRSGNAGYIKVHIMKKHSKSPPLKPFACENCDFKCSSAYYLKVHVGKKHGEAE